jgi:hypothetical protein
MAVEKILVELPADLVRDAREFDILNNNTLVGLIQTELDRRVMDFVNAEIRAYRAEKASRTRSDEGNE